MVPIFAPKKDRCGRKRGARLPRAPLGTALPILELSASQAAVQPAGQPAGPPAQRHWENNEDFCLEFVGPKSTLCAACQCPIGYLAAVPGERLVVRHAEQFVYPTGPAGPSRWSSTALSLHRKRNFFYHAKAACLLSRFSAVYFAAMPLRLGSGVRGELTQYPVDFQHGDLSL